MHIHFSGIGGTGIGPLALIAHQAGYEVTGSDKQNSQYIEYLKKHGIVDITIGQTKLEIASINQKSSIDWLVYSSAVLKEDLNHPEIEYAKKNNIKNSKRDDFLNYLLKEKDLKLIAISGTHGKSTTTAMAVWLLKELNMHISYSVGAKLSFGDMGQFDPESKYFIYECDEFDRNFLAFSPTLSIISGIAWDHHEIFPTAENYNQAFRDFLNQSKSATLWQKDASTLGIEPDDKNFIIADDNTDINKLSLVGKVNRENAFIVIEALQKIVDAPIGQLFDIMNRFPGLSRRMEEIVPNLYSDYAHTPEKIIGALDIAHEMAKKNNQKLIVIYEPLTNRRMHYTIDQHRHLFDDIDQLYWVPSYQAREDINQKVLSPSEIIDSLSRETKRHSIAMELNDELRSLIQQHIKSNNLVVALSGGGGNSLDEWLRITFLK